MDPAQLVNAVTERVTIPVLGGIENWRDQLKFMLQALSRQPGYLRTRWGPWSEDQQKLELITGWTNAETHDEWKKSADYTEAMARFAPVLDGEPSSCLLQFRPYAPQAVINSPIVEMLSFENCGEPDDRMREVVERAARMPGCNGVASGSSLRRPSSGSGGGGGEDAGVDGTGTGTGTGTDRRTFVAAIGWTALEASRRADKTAYTGGMKPESHHVDFNFPVKGFGGL
ncbi:dimeric alpha-beta barrel containing protein [Colletotrichum tabaci]|uniref:Dimeric alpha-beta barrel containing protein n=1 Tax=Colletotrichum tabaci TaxID=1209068 RepID=A0AAV9T8H7_9PEZI